MRNPVSRFAYAPVNLDMSRTRMNRTSTHKTTFNAGMLIPIYWDEVLPGDTYQMDVSSLVRMSTPVFPVMDNAYLDLYFFYVPNRVIWDHWKEFMGESPVDPYIESVEYSVPQLIRPTGQFPEDKDIGHGSLLDYLGLPAGCSVDTFNALPIRAYCKIWNDWFRDQNLMDAINFSTGDADVEYSTGYYLPRIEEPESWTEYFENYPTETARGGPPAPVSKYHDYFTSALLQPQKGDPVAIPINGFAPVYGIGGNPGEVQIAMGFGNEVLSEDVGTGYKFSNLYADLGSTAISGFDVYATINDLRYAFQIQKLLEADNRYGTRYIEIIKGHFGIDSPNAELQRAEFLGGKRVHINMQQVLQTSATNEVSPQGNTAAYSLTIDKGSEFVKSFTEHGIIMGVACVRTMHSYQQGLDRQFIRKDRYDYYFPELANISEQPIFNKEIYNAGGEDYDPTESNEVFGFQEPWAEYRYKPNRISGAFRSTQSGSLDSWHYGDFYEFPPRLSAEWIAENPFNIDRTLSVSSELADQFICDFYFDCKTTRIMPPYSIPGLADHH